MFTNGKDMTGEASVIIDSHLARGEDPCTTNVEPLPVLHFRELEPECSSTCAGSRKYLGYGNRLGSWRSAALINRKGWVTQSPTELIG